jgi:hypothetical protein
MTEKNPYNGRWRWWYAAIADTMLSHPDWSQAEIAKHLGKNPNTVSMIANTDLFKVYFADRRRQYSEVHDAALVQRMTRLAVQGLDELSVQLEKKKDLIPIRQVAEITMGALDRLGYSPNKPSPAVVVNNTNQTLVTPNASLGALQEAQAAMRQLEASKKAEPLAVIRRQHAANELLEDFEEAVLPPSAEDGPSLVLDGEGIEVLEEVEK